MRSILVASLLACLVFAQAENAFIVIHKTVSESTALLGSEVKVDVIAWNKGTGSAFNFRLEDDTHAKEVPVLAANENVTLTYALKAANLGQLEVSQASATWTASEESSDKLKAFSNVIREEERDETKHATEMSERGFVDVVTADVYERLNTRYIKETILYAFFALLSVGFPFSIYRQKQVQVDFHLKESRKK